MSPSSVLSEYLLPQGDFFHFLHLGALALHPVSSGRSCWGAWQGCSPAPQVQQQHSPSHIPSRILSTSTALHAIPGLSSQCSNQLGKHPLPVSPQIPAVPEGCCLVREILHREGVEVGAAMGSVPRVCLSRPHCSSLTSVLGQDGRWLQCSQALTLLSFFKQ